MSKLTHEQDPTCRSIEAPVNANVWKVLVQDGDTLEKGQTTTILEAMKMEINVNASLDVKGSKVVKTLIRPGDTVDPGQHYSLLRWKTKCRILR